MSRVKVTEPGTGVVVEVESDSPLATRWATKPEPKAAPKAQPKPKE